MQTEFEVIEEGNDSLVRFPRTSRHFLTTGTALENTHKEVVMYCENCHTVSVVYLECGDRTCYPCQKKRQRRIHRRYHDIVAKMGSPKFLTLTLVRGPLTRHSVQKLRKSFNKMRHRKIWTATGGIYQIEIGTIDGTTANLHVHAIIDSPRMEKADIRKAWKSITKDSYIVDIVECWSPRGALQYMTKHMGKKIGNPEHADLINWVLKGTRLVQGFGYLVHESMCYRISICEKCGAKNSFTLDFEILNYEYPAAPAGF